MQRRISKSIQQVPLNIRQNQKKNQLQKKHETQSQKSSQSQIHSIYKSNVKDSWKHDNQNKNSIIQGVQNKLQSSFSFNNSPNAIVTRKTSHNTTDIISYLQIVEKFIECAEIGDQESIMRMDRILSKDPKRFIYERTQKQHLINKINSRGYNSCYLAAKNGNLNVLKFLYKNKALFNIQILLNNKFSQIPIEVAARWQHHQTVNWMLENIIFDQNIINSIYLKTESIQIRNRLNDKVSLLVKFKSIMMRCCI